MQTGGAALGGVRARRAGGPAGRGDPRGQQRARHRHRPPRGQAHARGQARARARAACCSRRWWCRFLAPAADWCPALSRLGAAGARRAAARAAAHRARCPPAPTARRSTARSPARAACWPCSRCCSPWACCSREAHAAALSIPLQRAVRDRRRRGHGARAAAAAPRGGDGTVGYGEAAPFEPYDGVPLERAIAALTGGGGRRPPQARAAEEIARLDLQARQEGRPLAEPVQGRAAVNMTLPGGPPEEVAERARDGPRRGLRVLQAEGRAARRRRARGRGARGGRAVAGPAGGRERRLVGGRGRARDPRDRGPRPRVRRAALPHACGSCAEVRQRVSTPIAADESVSSLRELRARASSSRPATW